MSSNVATTLKDAFNACNPAKPLGPTDERYVDLAPGRGEEGSAVADCRKRILFSESSDLVQLFAGHRGCGKSTELRRLQYELEQAGYFVAYLELDADIDLEDIEPPDILLAIVRNLEAVLREAGHPLDAHPGGKELLEDFLLWFGEVVWETTERRQIEAEVRTQLEMKAEIPLFAKLLARFTGLIKTGTDSRKLLRQKLDPQVSQLVERGRLLVDVARSTVRKAGHEDLVLIVDDLDRIALKDRGDGRTSHEVLFVERGDLLKGFGCHTVVTVPISLVFSPKVTSLNAIFPDRHVLPMVKINDPRSDEPWTVGRELLVRVLGQRLDMKALFEEGVAEEFVRESGGHPRILMTLVRHALLSVDEPPVTMATAQRAFRRLVDDYGRSIPEEHWPHLARVHREKTVRNDDLHQQMLFHLSVLEYKNQNRWCDVQPAILELEPFQAALKEFDKGDDAS